ncbi:hypothetical protein Syun_022987 [Stephania yunnanensis]|uniref:Calcineurin B-like protein n=1 Tax=Stephania yunnanensis TaxID=152371 RepID=A0AAP0F8Z2_9MAGN
MEDSLILASQTALSVSEVKVLLLFKSISNSVGDDVIISKEKFQLVLFKNRKKENLFANHIFDQLDVKEKGVIDFGDFFRSLSVFHPNAPREDKISFSFKLYDLDGTGFIECQEGQGHGHVPFGLGFPRICMGEWAARNRFMLLPRQDVDLAYIDGRRHMVSSLLGGLGGAQPVMEEPNLSRRSPALQSKKGVWPWASMALGRTAVQAAEEGSPAAAEEEGVSNTACDRASVENGRRRRRSFKDSKLNGNERQMILILKSSETIPWIGFAEAIEGLTGLGAEQSNAQGLALVAHKDTMVIAKGNTIRHGLGVAGGTGEILW